MLKKILLIVVSLLIFQFIFAEVTYLSEEEYEDLSKAERENYNQNLLDEMDKLMEEKTEALENKEEYKKEIKELKAELSELNNEYETVKSRIMRKLGITEADLASIQNKIEYFNSKLSEWNNLTDDELWDYKKSIRGLIKEYNNYRDTNPAKAPQFRNEFSDLDRRIKRLENNLENARPKYYEDKYTVKRGDYLSKISGYDFIYNDPSKWGIIYRANRDKIKDPNLIYVDQILNIPRGLPYNWEVYKGECLWRIASYPEVYGSGAKWPLIYRANKDKIDDPDLIYPDQVFEIPRD
mgnify:CR=1 FL=1